MKHALGASQITSPGEVGPWKDPNLSLEPRKYPKYMVLNDHGGKGCSRVFEHFQKIKSMSNRNRSRKRIPTQWPRKYFQQFENFNKIS